MNPSHENRLASEKSPYLLQHAGNPVDWFPWGEEAFERARTENKPVFLSIGYSTCHWCHVMAHESFEDPDVAELMNDAFVSIKVDREERPDIDGIYMRVCQVMTGSGGWPLTIIMTPDKRPFFAATYIPRRTLFGRTGMLELVPSIKEMWRIDRDRIEGLGNRVTAGLQNMSQSSPGGELGPSVLDKSFEQLSSGYDDARGGFGAAPKFPTPHTLMFLLRYWRRTGIELALEMVEHTLTAMRLGGIYDHVGFGFHRYSTDSNWLVPHFEKMLYDQAMLAMAYIEAYQATGKDLYGRTAREILEYVLRDMTSPEGGFYSAEDADSEGEEGKFYVWTTEEIRETLSGEEADLVATVYNIEDEGNFLEEASRRRTGANILHMGATIPDLASELGAPEKNLRAKLDVIREKLFARREGRIHPLKDDKVLTDWNGLMIAAFAKAAQAFGDDSYARSAERAVDFIWRMRDEDGRLLHRFRDGEAAIRMHLDDYAFLVWGLLELYEATFDLQYIEKAIELNGDMVKHFWDEKGGFYSTADDSEELLVRQKEIYDGAIPSGNSVATLNMLRLARITSDPGLEEKAAGTAKAFSGIVEEHPSAHTQLMIALDFAIGPSYEVVVAGESGAEDTVEMLEALQRPFIPNKVVLLRPAEASPAIDEIAGFTEHHETINGRATAYVCSNFSCKFPTNDIIEMMDILRE